MIETDPVTGQVDRQQAHELLAALENVLWSVGGVARIAADREPIRDLGGKTEYRSVRYVVTWDSFAPARKPQQAEDPPEETDEALEAGAAEAA